MSIQTNIDRSVDAIAVRPVAGRIGAQISGVRLSGNLSPEIVAIIRQALLAHKVIFFQGQAHLTDNEQEGFAGLFGTPVPHPTLPVYEETNYVLNLKSDGTHAANQWHTDLTFVDAYPQASILRAVTVPSKGGDTVWANTVTAHDELTDELKHLAEQLWALHSNAHDYAAPRRDVNYQNRRQTFASTVYETEHPVVRVHPETGERSLVLGSFVERLIGYSATDSFHLFNVMQSHITRLENTVRWKWNVGDVAMWDNRATQHYGIGDFSEPREMRRVTVDGDVPVSVDGRRSVTRSKCANPGLVAASAG